jgi:hypothetical protein
MLHRRLVSLPELAGGYRRRKPDFAYVRCTMSAGAAVSAVVLLPDGLAWFVRAVPDHVLERISVRENS